MDLGFLWLSVCCVIASLQGGAWSSSSDNPGCPCPQIPTKSLTEPPDQGCRQISTRFRYRCIAGYVRKAGTSNLSVCKEVNGAAQWTPSDLVCIPHPQSAPPVPPPLALTTPRSVRTRSTSTAASGSTAPTSPGVTAQSDHREDPEEETSAADGTIRVSTTADPSSNRSADALINSDLSTKTTAAVVCVSLVVIVCALIGIGVFCYKWRSNNITPPHTTEEVISMN